MNDLAAARDHYPALLEATEPEPRTRIRIEHSRTIKEGWGYSTTVEVAYAGDDEGTDEDMRIRLEDLLVRTRLLAEQERDFRNERDGRP